jgi:hypothetical protein
VDYLGTMAVARIPEYPAAGTRVAGPNAALISINKGVTYL